VEDTKFWYDSVARTGGWQLRKDDVISRIPALRNLAFMHVYVAYSSPGLQPPSTNSRISVAYTCEHGSLPTSRRLAFPPTLLSFLEFNCQLPKFDRKNLYQSERRILRYRILSKFTRIYFDNRI